MKSIKNKIKAVIFDMDGTIIQSHNHWMIAVKKAVTENTKITDEQITQAIKSLAAKIHACGMETMIDILDEHLSLKTCKKSLKDKILLYAQQNFENKVGFICGFEEFHPRLAEHGIKSGIGTNANKNVLSRIAKTMEFEAFFKDHMYTPEDVKDKYKPHPDLFLHVAKMLGEDPENCVVFEDSFEGFKAANLAGMKCIAIKSEKNEPFLKMADQVIESYHQAEEALKKLCA